MFAVTVCEAPELAPHWLLPRNQWTRNLPLKPQQWLGTKLASPLRTQLQTPNRHTGLLLLLEGAVYWAEMVAHCVAKCLCAGRPSPLKWTLLLGSGSTVVKMTLRPLS